METHQVKQWRNRRDSRSHQLLHKLLGVGVLYCEMGKPYPSKSVALLTSIFNHPCRAIPERTGYIFRVDGVVRSLRTPPKGVSLTGMENNDVRVSTKNSANERWECNSWPRKNEIVKEGGAETLTLTASRLVITLVKADMIEAVQIKKG